jgi:hypothetical protein
MELKDEIKKIKEQLDVLEDKVNFLLTLEDSDRFEMVLEVITKEGFLRNVGVNREETYKNLSEVYNVPLVEGDEDRLAMAYEIDFEKLLGEMKSKRAMVN